METGAQSSIVGSTMDAGSDPLVSRADFSILQNVIYLNAASVALTPEPVHQEALAFDRAIAGHGTVGFDDAAEARVYEGARASIGRLLHTTPANIAIMTSATEAIAQIAHWLRPVRGQNIVTAEIEFPSVTYPWLRLSKETGLEVRLAATQTPGELSIEHIERLVDKETAAICLSHVQYATGGRLDPKALADLAHGHRALLILDASQSAGVVPLDVCAADQDVVLGSAYKWLCGSLGAAFCYMRPEVWCRFDPPFVGPRSTVNPSAFDATRINLANAARRMEYSTVAYSAGLAMAAAAEYLMACGIEHVFTHAVALGTRLINGLERLGGRIVTPKESERRAGIICVTFPRQEAAFLVDALARKNVIVSPRLGAIRFSPHLYNSASDIDRCLDVLSRVLRE